MLDQTQTDLWYGTKGRPDAPVVFVGESWGEAEAAKRIPFVGSSGAELDRMLALAGVNHGQVLFTNVRAEQPRGNEMWRFFEPSSTYQGKQIGGLAPNIATSEECSRLYKQILSCPRKLVIASGNYALWALSQVTGSKKLAKSNNRPIPKELQTWVPSGIMDWRGSMWYCKPHEELFPAGMQTRDWAGMQLLPVVHPAAIMRAWYMRDPTIHDFKHRVRYGLAGDWRPDYEFLAPPTFEQAIRTLEGWLRNADLGTVFRLACDIETLIYGRLITCVGFADSPTFAISIPFIRKVEGQTHRFDSWWSPEQEAQITWLIIRILSHPNITIDGQNFIYDTQYFQKFLGVTPKLDHDTMIHQNVVFPGVPKALEYLSSIYCHYHWYWKEDHKEWDLKGTVEQLLGYNCLDCVRTWEIGGNQRLVTEHLAQQEQFRFKMEVNDLCLRMMNRGVLFDSQRAAVMRFEMQEALSALHAELLEIIPQEWIGPVGKRSKDKGSGEIYWMTSDVQQKLLFYEILGFKVVRDPKTGSRTTGKKALGQFKIWYPEFTGLIDRLRKASTIEQTIGVLKSQIDADSRIRCSYNPGGPESHRLSSSENAFGGGTNLQNLTKGQEDDD